MRQNTRLFDDVCMGWQNLRKFWAFGGRFGAGSRLGTSGATSATMLPANLIMNGGAITNNTAPVNNNTSGYGAGISLQGISPLTMNRDPQTGETPSISGNSADLYGGGIYASDTSQVTINNGLINGNSVTGSGSLVGGIFLSKNAGLTIGPGTVSNNSSAGDGGGIYLQDSAACWREGICLWKYCDPEYHFCQRRRGLCGYFQFCFFQGADPHPQQI
ncbi:MAG: hypothetical protein FWF59_09920 [Turicibacter sp.]|nr:hypothetical protein [Turicibacter sp.]